MSTIHKYTQAHEVKFADEGEGGLIEGLASPFGGAPDSYGDVIAKGAYAKAIARRDPVAMLWSHDQARPIGKWLNMQETAAGLEVRGRLNLKTTAGREAYEHARAGDITGLSIGYQIETDGAENIRGGRLLKDVRLFEISLVSIPAASTARVSGVKTFADVRELKSALRELGCSKEAAERVARGGWAALSGEIDLNPLSEQVRALRAAAAQLAGE